MNSKEVIQAIKLKWITEFGELGKELPSVGCYFIVGFVQDAIKDMQSTPQQDFNAMDFKLFRVKQGWTLRDVTGMTGISNPYLSQLENGKIKKPSHDVVLKLTNLMNKS